MAGSGAIRILRGNGHSSDEILEDGQPYFDKAANDLYIGQGKQISQTDVLFKPRFEEIDRRLDELGFKEGAVVVESGSISSSSLKKQGKYCIFTMMTASKGTTISIPEGFRPRAAIAVAVSRPLAASTFFTLNVDGRFYTNDEMKTEAEFEALSFIQNAGWEIA